VLTKGGAGVRCAQSGVGDVVGEAHKFGKEVGRDGGVGDAPAAVNRNADGYAGVGLIVRGGGVLR
jgi:hypothetical protein